MLDTKYKFLQPTSIRHGESERMDDLILLHDINEDNVVEYLTDRYVRSQSIYTYIGPVLIAINPYKELKMEKDGNVKISIYDPTLLQTFSGRQMHELSPHPFALAENAYSHLMRNFTNETILITGESGSGKTETSKHILKYIANISKTKRTKAARTSRRSMTALELGEAEDVVDNVRNVLLGSNSILEAFGNAKTTRNLNSSRFGKYMVVQMNYGGQVVGGYVSNYLLERSRVYRQASGERNFHAFYQFLQGASDNQKTLWDLLPVKSYNYLCNDDSVDDKDDVDAKQHQVVMSEMRSIGMKEEDITHVYQMLATVLWLGNVQFVALPPEADGLPNTAICETSKDAVTLVAELLGLSQDWLEQSLMYRTIVTGSQSARTSEHLVPLNVTQATQVRDALSKTLYESLFNWIVAHINGGIVLQSNENHKTIGILDIYGFEIFKKNGFEQLCINYVNEKLQQLFISNTIQVEQEEYRRERVGWTDVEYFDNQIVCDLIEHPKHPGMFPLLDEQCAISDFNATTLINRFHGQYSKHAHYKKPRIKGCTFSLLHYAGEVEYDVTNFLESNVDTVFNDIVDLLQTSTLSFVSRCFHEQFNRPSSERFKRPPTTSYQFRQQVAGLLSELESTSPHYVRCIKPNKTKKVMHIDPEVLRHQVRYLGLVENLRVRRAGYCYRATFSKFLQRFKMLSPETWPNPSKELTAKEACLKFLKCSDVSANTNITFGENIETDGCFALGRTRLFLRFPKGLFALEKLRSEVFPRMVGIVEGAFIRYKKRNQLANYVQAYLELQGAHDAVMVNIRDRVARVPGSKDKDRRDALYSTWSNVCSHLQLSPTGTFMAKRMIVADDAIVVAWMQSYVRARNAQRRFRKLRSAANVMASAWKGLAVRRAMSTKEWQSCRNATLGIRSELERFMGKKKRRRASLDRIWHRDYVDAISNEAVKELLVTHGQEKVFFASWIDKTNQVFHVQKRLLLVTDNLLFNIKSRSKLEKLKVRRVIDLSKLMQLSLSTLPDNYMVLHVPSEYDYLISVEYKTELIQILRERCRRLYRREIKIQFANQIQFNAHPEVLHTLRFLPDRSSKNPVKAEKQDKDTLQITVCTR